MAGYGTDQGFTDWLASYGHTLPAGAPSPAILRQRGSTYLDATYEGLWTGTRTGGIMQERAWPRAGAVINCATPIADDVIPPSIIEASYRAAWLEGTSPGSTSGSSSVSGKRVKRQKVDVIEKEFFDDGSASAGSGNGAFIDPEIDGSMMMFICDQSGDNIAFVWALGS